MRHYYFHIRSGTTLIRDDEGLECRDMKAALAEAFASARDAARATLYRPNAEAGFIQIEDDDGDVVGEIPFTETRH